MELLCKGAHTCTHLVSPFPQFTVQHTRFVSEDPTFRDLPVVSEPPAQRDGDGWQVGHVVAVAVHAAVPSGADRLWGQTGAVEARV